MFDLPEWAWAPEEKPRRAIVRSFLLLRNWKLGVDCAGMPTPQAGTSFSRRKRWLGISMAILLVAAVVGLKSPRPSEPVYQGRPVTRQDLCSQIARAIWDGCADGSSGSLATDRFV